jgi:hypothetical protein
MSEPYATQPLTMLFEAPGVYVWGFTHQLGRMGRNLAELKAAGLLCNDVSDLAKLGYANNFGIAEDESLFTLATGPFRCLLELCPQPQALVFHHSYASSASASPVEYQGTGFMRHARYFPAELLRGLDLDHVPYLGSFSTGCTGFFSLIMMAAGPCAYSGSGPLICLTADTKPADSTYDAEREKILTSDCASGFLVGRERRGYRALGLSFYSSKRELVPLVEIVKRTVQMVRHLMEALAIRRDQCEFVLHYPNIFPAAWPMVTDYLQLPRDTQNPDGLSERAHCLSSDPVISLAGAHRGQAGRLHVVVGFGSGLHLGVGLFREEPRDESGA